MSELLIRQMREQRMSWVDLGEGKSVRIIRPSQLEMMRYLLKDKNIVVEFDDVMRFCVDWRGFTQADLLGAAVGSADPVGFDIGLWRELSSEHAPWLQTIANAIVQAIVAKHAADGDSLKN
jgi:hypothetical protein